MTEWLIRDSRDAGRMLHPTTQAVLMAMQDFAQRHPVARVLDMGCGSGILTLVACELWPGSAIVAADISLQAVADAQENIRLHQPDAPVEIIRSDGFSHPLIAERGPYDFIICNLLSELVVRFAADMKPLLAPGGAAALSGILAWQVAQVKEAFTAIGFEITHEIGDEQWRTLVVTAV